jgi:hypothetical protein
MLAQRQDMLTAAAQLARRRVPGRIEPFQEARHPAWSTLMWELISIGIMIRCPFPIRLA